MTDLGDLWSQVAPLGQGTLLGGLLMLLLRIMYVERREHRDEMARVAELHRAEVATKNERLRVKDERIAALEEAHHKAVLELEAEIDAERDKRRRIEDAAARPAAQLRRRRDPGDDRADGSAS